MPALTARTIAPDFKLPTLAGPTFSLATALQRGPVVLVFFKISCPVCQYALPFFERMYRGYKGTGVSILGVSQNSKEDTESFRKEYRLTLPIALDDPAKYPVSNTYGLTNVPTSFLVMLDGTIEVSSVGWSRAEFEVINRKLASTLQAAQAPVFRPGEEVAEFRPG